MRVQGDVNQYLLVQNNTANNITSVVSYIVASFGVNNQVAFINNLFSNLNFSSEVNGYRQISFLSIDTEIAMQ